MAAFQLNERVESLPIKQINPWQELPKLSVVVMEISWVVPWFQLITLVVKDKPQGEIALVFGMVTVVAYFLNRFLFLLSLKKKYERGIFLGYVFVAILSCIWLVLYRETPKTDVWNLYNQPLDAMTDIRELIPPEVVVTLFVLFLIRRGFLLARNWGGANSVVSCIQTSIVMYIIYGVIFREDTDQIINMNMYLFLVSAIFGMMTARIDSIRGQRGGRVIRFDFQWMWGVLSTTVLITGISAAVSILSTTQLNKINQMLKFVFYSLFFLVATPFFTLISRFFPALEELQKVAQALQDEQNVPEWEGETGSQPQGVGIEDVAGRGMELILQLRFMIFVLLIVFGIFLVIRISRKWRSGVASGADDDHQSLLADRSWLQLLLDALRNQVRKTADSVAHATRLNRRDQIRAAARIRWIYGQFLELCEASGYARISSQTPQEFLPAAASIFPQTQEEILLITDSYQRIRYGEFPETHREVQAVEIAWKQIREQGAAIKKHTRSPE